MTTVKQFMDGAELPEPIYISKPYEIIGDKNVVLFAGTLQELKDIATWSGGYYDNCKAEIREYDLYLCDNTKVPPAATPAEKIKTLREALEHIRDVFWNDDETHLERLEYVQRHARETLEKVAP